MKKFKREWVWKAATAFLALMLFFTFFSNTIMNISLPEVMTAQPESGVITNAVRGQANVESMGSYSIEVDSQRHILAVYVRDGDTVSQGDPLFLLEAGENDLMDQLRTLRLQYEKMLLDLTGSDHAMQNETIRQAREDLERAQRERAALGTAEMTETAAQVRVDEATAAVATASTRLAQLELELTYLDTFDARSAYIGRFVIAYEQARANFFENMGVDFDDYTGPPNQWSQAVESAATTMRNEAAQARVTVARDVSAAAAQLASAEATRTSAENTLARIQRINAAEDAVRAAQRTLNAALIALSDTQQQDNVTHQQRLLDLRELEREIDELEARIRRQEGDLEGGDTTVTARYDGVIVNLTAVAGQSTSPGVPLAQIEVAQMGYVAEMAVDARQAQEIRPGMVVEVRSLNWWASLTGQVTSIRPDADNPANSRIVAVEVQGEVFPGEQVSISIPIAAARFDMIVPRSAVAQDAQGEHVFVLVSRQSPLGTRYTARRVDVTIEAQDDTHIAIRGDLEHRANIIIRSSGVLADRDAVRLATD